MNGTEAIFCGDIHDLTFASFSEARTFTSLVSACMDAANPYRDTDDEGNEVWRLECKLFDFLFGDEEDDDD